MVRPGGLFVVGLALACGSESERADETAASTTTGTESGSESVAVASEGSTSTGVDPGTTSTEADESSSGTTGAPALPPSIGLVQYDADAHFGDWDTNAANLTLWAKAAIDQGARIVVFPEGSSWGYASATELWCSPGMASFEGRSCRDVSTVAEVVPGGPTTEYWASFAAQHGVAVVYHVIERDGPAYYNALGVVDPNGFVTRYRKRALYYVDTAYASAGSESVVLDTPWGRFGLMICLDGTYDGEYYDDYNAMGVDGIVIAMDWDDDPEGEAAAIDWFRDRADANGVKIYAADVSTWDGTALYLPGDVPRERNGLPPIAVGIDGISVHDLAP